MPTCLGVCVAATFFARHELRCSAASKSSRWFLPCCCCLRPRVSTEALLPQRPQVLLCAAEPCLPEVLQVVPGVDACVVQVVKGDPALGVFGEREGASGHSTRGQERSLIELACFSLSTCQPWLTTRPHTTSADNAHTIGRSRMLLLLSKPAPDSHPPDCIVAHKLEAHDANIPPACNHLDGVVGVG